MKTYITHTHTASNWKFPIVLFCLMFSSLILNAQESQTHYYYIEEASYDLLKPTNQTLRQDGTKNLAWFLKKLVKK
jgi:hypothetical protein